MENCTTTFTRRDRINSQVAATLQVLAETPNNRISVDRAAIIDRPDTGTGEVKQVGVLVTTDGDYFTTISATAIRAIDELIEIIDEEGGPVSISCKMKQSKSGRDFIAVTIY